MSKDLEIIEVPLEEENGSEEVMAPTPTTKRGRKPLTGAAREKALQNLAKAREKAAHMRKKRGEQKQEMMMAREEMLLKQGRPGYGPSYYEDEYSDDDEYDDTYDDSDPDDRYISKIYKQTPGRPGKTASKYPVVSATPLDYYDDYPPPKGRGRPRKAPSLKDQQIDLIQRKLNQLIDHIKVKRQPKKTKNTIIMTPQAPAPVKQTVPAEVQKEIKRAIALF